MEGEWKQRRGRAIHQWGKMMNDELAAIAGKYEELVGRLQVKYGIAKEEAKGHVDEFKSMVDQLKESNSRLTKLQKTLSKRKKEGKRPAKSQTAKKRRKQIKSSR
jgi:uncharacterized protein YjbJ (UPF0337 family)